MKYFIGILLLFVGHMLHAQERFVSAGHEAFYYSGRVDLSQSDVARFDWPGVSVNFQFTGETLDLCLNGGERNYFNVFIDGLLHEVMHVPADTVYPVRGINGQGWHSCRIQKRTEGEMGMVVFKGVHLEKEAQIRSVEHQQWRKIEFIGNSITCGYGTEGKLPEEDFLPETENINKSYAFIAARAFKAECYVTAHSGLGVVRNYGDKEPISTKLATLPNRYHQVFDMDTSLAWDFSQWQPDAVVINLGTNDYSTDVAPEKSVFVQRYLRFIKQLRDCYGDIPVFCVNGPMRDEPAYSNVKEVVEIARSVYGDKHIYFIGIPASLLNKSSDLGSDYHPSYRGQLKMARHIIPTIANVMNWEFDDSEYEALSY
ncbi:endoglucanase [Carboxylicivirga mesophila]|uniref:Endoglucanase n=1 Tax=Carboxylicivirga mesophila TaxID=1166478 RepID=A0ABS5KA82_9BACT|nr:SGNH/GDSL hydrolase family protein [Carboxylicivirga mesophila]MBS2211920.1 endoglucanase [Carboxylicivirga mesophila]